VTRENVDGHQKGSRQPLRLKDEGKKERPTIHTERATRRREKGGGSLFSLRNERDRSTVCEKRKKAKGAFSDKRKGREVFYIFVA